MILYTNIPKEATKKLLELINELSKVERYKINIQIVIAFLGTSLVVQWLRLCAPNAGGPGSIPGHGTRSHMPQLKRSHMPQLKILHATTKIPHTAMKIPRAATKTRCSQISKYFLKKEKRNLLHFFTLIMKYQKEKVKKSDLK